MSDRPTEEIFAQNSVKDVLDAQVSVRLDVPHAGLPTVPEVAHEVNGSVISKSK